MTTYTAWYLTIAALVHGQMPKVTHSGPTKLVVYFTGAANISFTFRGHAATVLSYISGEIMHAMWKPQKFKHIYLLATLYVFTLTIPSAASVYWEFGDQLLNHANAFSLLPRTCFSDAAVILMLIHQSITFGFASMPLYFVWEKMVGAHNAKSLLLRAVVRLPVVIPIWLSPFFGPINSAVGALLNAVGKLSFFLPSWTAVYVLNAFIVVWVMVVGFGFGGWASIVNFVKQVGTFGLFAKCYQCHPQASSSQPAAHL
ncbi:Auxin transporter-like protein [Drosera capensis]